MQHRGRLLTAAATALLLALPVGSAWADTKNIGDAFDKAATTGRLSATATPRVLDADTKVDVMVQLSGDPVAVAQAKASGGLSSGQRTAVERKLRLAQDALAPSIKAKGGKVVTQLQNAYNGIRVRIAEGKVNSLKSLPGVSGVHTLTPKTLDNAVSVPFLGVPQVWQNTGKTGKGVKVAIIDTGIDYTHADFGGPGTEAAFTAAKAASTTAAPAALFGPSAPRIKGGYDFVGDNYDASGDTAGSSTTPTPDPNPLDCNGHGTHVAGTVGGSGVTSDGKTYTGAYNASTPKTSFAVGPGVAPQVDLYALRVFGCEGSTDVTVEAIDWAVKNRMNVINMSLGSSFGRSDDPDAVAASNAVGAGVVVVASSGNSGPNPYLTGSPATGAGVLSVAAIDSTATFPGAKLSLSGGATLSSINANNAALPSASLKLVVVGDDTSTTANEALGCSKDAYTKAGISSQAGNQIAVVSRGTCSRVAKAIYAQQAGAAAVIMINNTTDYPPYEGAIVSNPDTGDKYKVTIPLLGVRTSDAATLTAAAGQSVTLSATTLDNPAYRSLASFSSAGPVTGDSGLSPNVSAPGVSILSASVGTGNGGEIMSGTSMAAPHVTGVAALGVQAHPTWSAAEVAAAVASTADPDAIAGYQVTLGGTGLVDAAQTVGTQVIATGDPYRTTSGWGEEDSLSFGFAEPNRSFTATRFITLSNLGTTPVTYTLSSVASAQSRPATVRLGLGKVTVPPCKRVRIPVTLSVQASTVGSSLAGIDQFSYYEVSGAIVATSSSGTLRVPYLLVPRAQAQVQASIVHDANYRALVGKVASVKADRRPGKPWPTPTPSPSAPRAVSIALGNYGGALPAVADFYTWGLWDAQNDLATGSTGSGYDLRAAGVQSVADGTDQLLVFAVNSYTRWSNAAALEFDVSIDTNADGKADYIVYSADAGATVSGDANGVTSVYVYNVATKELSSSGYDAQAPTDSSTILLPVKASDLGLTSAAGTFKYTVAGYTTTGTGSDAFSGWATYNPFSKPLGDGTATVVGRNQNATATVAVDLNAYAAQYPMGLMVVVLDNRSGSSESLLLAPR